LSEQSDRSAEKIVIEIMPKRDLLDPQGKAVAGALHRAGQRAVSQVRIGKRIELQFDRQVSESDLADARKLAAEFLSNDVIEDVVSITVESIA